jgi:hypothetical protein
MAEKRKMESSEQGGLKKCLSILETKKMGIIGKNRINGISLLNEFDGEILENERGIHVPMLKKAFEHIMKTEIGQDETIPDDLLQVIHGEKYWDNKFPLQYYWE